MPRQFKTARKMNKLKLKEAAVKLGISQPTLSSWESGRKSPTLDGLENMANLYGVTTDFLLGRTVNSSSISKEPISLAALPVMHGNPIWSAKLGWMIVDGVAGKLIIDDEHHIPFEEAGELYIHVPYFSELLPPGTEPLSKSAVSRLSEIWVEPISIDTDLRQELRGWYHVKKCWVENEYGNKFYLDTYGSKWLAFDNILHG